MKCPKCGSEDTVIRTSTTAKMVKKFGFFWSTTHREEKTETCRRCLDCGAEWEGEDA